MGQEIDALKVLVVEDNLQARTMIRMMCKELGISQVPLVHDDPVTPDVALEGLTE